MDDKSEREQIKSLIATLVNPTILLDEQIEAVKALLSQRELEARKDELERLDDVYYDDGRVNWGEPTEESQEEWGKNHADLVLPTRYIHDHIKDRLKALQAQTGGKE